MKQFKTMTLWPFSSTKVEPHNLCNVLGLIVLTHILGYFRIYLLVIWFFGRLAKAKFDTVIFQPFGTFFRYRRLVQLSLRNRHSLLFLLTFCPFLCSSLIIFLCSRTKSQIEPSASFNFVGFFRDSQAQSMLTNGLDALFSPDKQ